MKEFHDIIIKGETRGINREVFKNYLGYDMPAAMLKDIV